MIGPITRRVMKSNDGTVQKIREYRWHFDEVNQYIADQIAHHPNLALLDKVGTISAYRFVKAHAINREREMSPVLV